MDWQDTIRERIRNTPSGGELVLDQKEAGASLAKCLPELAGRRDLHLIFRFVYEGEYFESAVSPGYDPALLFKGSSLDVLKVIDLFGADRVREQSRFSRLSSAALGNLPGRDRLPGREGVSSFLKGIFE